MGKTIVPPAGTVGLPAHVRQVLELEHTAFRDEALERLRIQASLAQSTFRLMVLANGGAIIALFTLLGSGASFAQQSPSLPMWLGFGAFVAGLTATIGALVCGFFMQLNYTNATMSQMWNKEQELLGVSPTHQFQGDMKRGGHWELAAIACTVIGLLGFVAGSALCLTAFIP